MSSKKIYIDIYPADRIAKESEYIFPSYYIVHFDEAKTRNCSLKLRKVSFRICVRRTCNRCDLYRSQINVLQSKL